MEELRRAAEAHDSAAVIALFSPGIIVRSPITQLIRFEGYDQEATCVNGYSMESVT